MCRRGSIRGVVLVVSAIFAGTLSGQTRPEPVTEPDRIYESFFREVVAAPRTSELVETRLNGDQPVQMYRRSAQEWIGLNDQEMKMLTQTASECVDQITELARASIAWRKEAFFQRIESGRASPELETRLQGMQVERLRILFSAVEKLKSGFEASRFALLDAFIRSNPLGRDFFPLIGSAGVPLRTMPRQAK